MANREGRGPFDFEAPGMPRMPKFNLPSVPPRTIRLVLAILAGLVSILTGYYQVEPAEVGVVQRFGRFVRQTDPGPHLKIPFVERVTKVPVERQLKSEFGFRTVQPGIRTQYQKGNQFLEESLMLSGDLNVAVVEWIVQYKIKDPSSYLFKVRDVDSTFRAMAEASMRQVVGDHSVDETLTIGREQIAARAKNLLQSLCDRYEIGITVQQLVLQDVNPPDPVKPSFNEVNQAIQEKERLTNEAWADYNQTIPRARGEALQMIQEAEGYALERVNRAQGEATRFEAVYAEYRKAPEVTRKRLYIETVSELLPRLGRKVILDEGQKGILPLLNLAEEVKK